MNISSTQQFWLESDFVLELLKQIPAYVFWKDKNSVYLGCNNAFAHSLGLATPEEIVGKTDYDLLTTKQESDYFRADDYEVIATGKAKLNIEESQTLAGGHKVSLLTNKVPLIDKQNKVMGILGIYYDITERKNKEEELRQAKEKAEIASKTKTEFLENMSHDLRTPMVGILGMAESIEDDIIEPKNKDRAKKIIKSSKRLLDLVNQILETIEDDHSKDIIEVFNLKNFLQSLEELLLPSIINKNLTFNLNIAEKVPILFKGDANNIYRILLNVLSNAVKFTDKGSISLNVTVAKTKPLLVSFEIKDQGIGIANDKFQAIFEPFTRLTPSHQGAYKGTGLGLHLVDRLVKKLQGNINVASKVGEGTSFVIILPLIKITDKQSNTSETYKNNSSWYIQDIQAANNELILAKSIANILLVEDDDIAGEVVLDKFARLNIKGDWAKSGQEAIFKVRENIYDLIYMDIGLLDKRGDQVAREIRHFELQQQRNAIPIIALTAHIDAKGKQGCFDAGMNIVENKPLSSEKIQQHLAQFVTNTINTIPKTGELKVIDRDLGIRNLESEDNWQTIIKMLYKKLLTEKKSLTKLYDTNQWNEIKIAAHTLNGNASWCGTPRLKKAAEKLETALSADSQNNDLATMLYQDLQNEIANFLQDYKNNYF